MTKSFLIEIRDCRLIVWRGWWRWCMIYSCRTAISLTLFSLFKFHDVLTLCFKDHLFFYFRSIFHLVFFKLTNCYHKSFPPYFQFLAICLEHKAV